MDLFGGPPFTERISSLRRGHRGNHARAWRASFAGHHGSMCNPYGSWKRARRCDRFKRGSERKPTLYDARDRRKIPNLDRRINEGLKTSLNHPAWVYCLIQDKEKESSRSTIFAILLRSHGFSLSLPAARPRSSARRFRIPRRRALPSSFYVHRRKGFYRAAPSWRMCS